MGATKSDMEGPRVIAEEAAAATPDEDHIATLGQFVHELAEGLEVTLVDAAGMEPLEDPGPTFVDLFQFGLRYSQANGFLLQQFTVVDLHPQPLAERGRKALLTGPKFTRKVKTRRGVELPQAAAEAPRTIAATTATTSSRGTRSRVEDQVILCRLGRLVAEEVTGEATADAVYLRASGHRLV